MLNTHHKSFCSGNSKPLFSHCKKRFFSIYYYLKQPGIFYEACYFLLTLSTVAHYLMLLCSFVTLFIDGYPSWWQRVPVNRSCEIIIFKSVPKEDQIHVHGLKSIPFSSLIFVIFNSKPLEFNHTSTYNTYSNFIIP